MNARKQLTRTRTYHPRRTLSKDSHAIRRPNTPRAGRSTTPKKVQAHHPGDSPDPESRFKWDVETESETEKADSDSDGYDSFPCDQDQAIETGYESVLSRAKKWAGLSDDDTEPEVLNDEQNELVDKYLEWEEEAILAGPSLDINKAMNWRKRAKGLMKDVKFQ